MSKGNGRPKDDLPPANDIAEKQTLASLLILGRGFEYSEVSKLWPGHFTDVPRQRLFAEMLAARDAGKPIDGTLLAHRLNDNGTFASYQDAEHYLQSIIATEATGSGLRTYAEKVSEAARVRRGWEASGLVREKIIGRKSADEIRDLLKDWLNADEQTGNGGIEYETITLAELKDAVEPEYFIPGILPTSQPGVIAGQWKSLKTTAAVELAYCIAVPSDPDSFGNRFLGQYEVAINARVGMFSGEAQRTELKRIVRRVGEFHGDSDPWRHDGLIFSCERLPKIGSKQYMDALARWIDRNRLRICIIDPGYAALAAVGDGAGNYYRVAELLFQVTELQRKTGCVMLLCPHMTKAPKYDPPMLSDIQWSGFSEWSGTWILLGKRREWDDQNGLHWLWMVAGGRTGHALTVGLDVREGHGGQVFEPTIVDKSAAFGVTIDAQNEQRQRQRSREQDKAEQSIRDAFRALGHGCHVKAHVLERTGTSGKGRAIQDAWAAMLRTGEIKTSPGALRGGQNKPCDGYSWNPLKA